MVKREPASSALLSYALSLDVDLHDVPMTRSHVYTLPALVQDLLNIAEAKPVSNNAVVPALQTLIVLLEGDALHPLARNEGTACLQL